MTGTSRAAPTAPAGLPPTLPDAAAAVAWLRALVPAVPGRGRLRSDSRQVQPGDAFIAWPGQASDGRRHVGAALAAGAAACLVEAQGLQALASDPALTDPRVAALHGLKAAAGELASRFLGAPGAQLEVVATTGTNGKTSTAWWTAQALSALGRRAGVIGTLGVGEPPQLRATGLTTPDPITLHAALRDFVDAGVRAVAIEASSIGIVEQRLAALPVQVALFTNFTRDHLDYHGSMAAYWAAKRRLFSWPGLRAAVINIDDEQGAALAQELRGTRALDLWTVSMQRPARLQARALRYPPQGLAFEVVECAAESSAAAGDTAGSATLQTQLVGDYNVSNLLVVLGGLRALGQALPAAAAALSGVSPVPGRLQRISGAGIDIVVDYAHTPDALDKALAALRPLARERGTRLWCIFGCGGDRDPSKRPLMGAIAARGADRVVLTSDNPRSEAPAAILAQIAAGITGRSDVDRIEDRRAAIAFAVGGAAAGDVLLLAGKGHEDYQETAGVKRPFSDLEEARAALARRASSSGVAA